MTSEKEGRRERKSHKEKKMSTEFRILYAQTMSTYVLVPLHVQ
jgi:hypothetical protein